MLFIIGYILYILSKHQSYCPVFAGRQWQHSCLCRQRNERMDGSRHSVVGRRMQTGGVEYTGRIHRHQPSQTVDYEHHQRCRSVTTYGCSRQENVRLVRSAVAACGAISRLTSTSTKQTTPETSDTRASCADDGRRRCQYFSTDPSTSAIWCNWNRRGN